MHGNDQSTSQISVGWIDIFDDNMENIVDMYRILIKSLDDTYHFRSVKWYRAQTYTRKAINKSPITDHRTTENWVETRRQGVTLENKTCQMCNLDNKNWNKISTGTRAIMSLQMFMMVCS